ncbi:unnamed protein product [Paramecium primaurelia]|uniref:UBC core domain-containing protein n=2 Tax=Paramecium TaxID=5884 RepID=A0A8S1XH94_9CILI|nr:unnamed protein product [Paramecium primaurelia]CAD8200465.1 unnamed protein product [Paramecium pentaurelia]
MIAIKIKKEQQIQQNAVNNQDITQTGAWKRALSDQQEFNDAFPPDLKNLRIYFPDNKNILYFEVEVRPDHSFWAGGLIVFTVSISLDYPMTPPKVLCKKKIFHPNIDLEGKVCLNILREDWRPVSSLKDVIFGLQMLFTQLTNPTDPLNKEAAELMLKDQAQFAQVVKSTMKGGSYNGVLFEKIA